MMAMWLRDEPADKRHNSADDERKRDTATQHLAEFALPPGTSQWNADFPRQPCLRSREANGSFPRPRKAKLVPSTSHCSPPQLWTKAREANWCHRN